MNKIGFGKISNKTALGGITIHLYNHLYHIKFIKDKKKLKSYHYDKESYEYQMERDMFQEKWFFGLTITNND